MSNDKNTLFTDTPVKKAVLTLAIPTVISQLISLLVFPLLLLGIF